MSKEMTQGKCYLCQGVFPKNQMTKHLETCMQKQPAETEAPRQRTFRILAEGHGQPEYWLYFEIPAEAKFSSIDRFLRKTWVECCGHMSAFTIEGTRYSVSPMRDFDEKSMKVALGDVLRPGMKFYHEYDFGTTTELILRVVSEREGEFGGASIQVLARNEPPLITCDSCGATATQVCSQCIWEDGGWLCDECAQEHECGEEMLLPVVNSPRVGMCAYTG